MELYQEKMQLRYHTPVEAQAISDKTAEFLLRQSRYRAKR